MSSVAGAVVVVFIIVASIVWISEVRKRNALNTLLHLNRVKKEQAEVEEELTKATEEVKVKEISYKEKLDAYNKKYHPNNPIGGNGNGDGPC